MSKKTFVIALIVTLLSSCLLIAALVLPQVGIWWGSLLIAIAVPMNAAVTFWWVVFAMNIYEEVQR